MACPKIQSRLSLLKPIPAKARLGGRPANVEYSDDESTEGEDTPQYLSSFSRKGCCPRGSCRSHYGSICSYSTDTSHYTSSHASYRIVGIIKTQSSLGATVSQQVIGKRTSNDTAGNILHHLKLLAFMIRYSSLVKLRHPSWIMFKRRNIVEEHTLLLKVHYLGVYTSSKLFFFL